MGDVCSSLRAQFTVNAIATMPLLLCRISFTTVCHCRTFSHLKRTSVLMATHSGVFLHFFFVPPAFVFAVQSDPAHINRYMP
jgi:hypothetical protein